MDLMNERKSEHRWKWIKRFTFSTIGALLFAVYLAFYASSLGYRLIPNTEIVGVVNVSGSIGSGQLASAEELVPTGKSLQFAQGEAWSGQLERSLQVGIFISWPKNLT
jgi:hypothetical protein